MKFDEVKNNALILDAKQQAKVKGGNSDANTTDSIIIGDTVAS